MRVPLPKGRTPGVAKGGFPGGGQTPKRVPTAEQAAQAQRGQVRVGNLPVKRIPAGLPLGVPRNGFPVLPDGSRAQERPQTGKPKISPAPHVPAWMVKPGPDPKV